MSHVMSSPVIIFDNWSGDASSFGPPTRENPRKMLWCGLLPFCSDVLSASSVRKILRAWWKLELRRSALLKRKTDYVRQIVVRTNNSYAGFRIRYDTPVLIEHHDLHRLSILVAFALPRMIQWTVILYCSLIKVDFLDMSARIERAELHQEDQRKKHEYEKRLYWGRIPQHKIQCNNCAS